jgi:deoxyribonuclease V
MATVWVRAYEELNEFLPDEKRKRTFGHELHEGTTVSKLLTDLGIPSLKVDLVLAGDTSVDFAHVISNGERISLYPVFETLDIVEVTRVRREPLRSTRFITDRSLNRLAVYLRLLGFDVASFADKVIGPDLLRQAEAEERIFLTQDYQDIDTAAMSRVLFIKGQSPGQQLREVLSRLDLYRAAARHAWDVVPDEAREIQERLRHEVVIRDDFGNVGFIGAADVAFEENNSRVRAVVAVLSFPQLELCESAVAVLPLQFPYLPGLLSFRETPAILQALAKLRQLPDLLFCDGHGLAHPRRFGMACHIGVLSGIASIGVAKKLLIGNHGELPHERGAWVPLIDRDETIGAVVRTRAGVKPVYVSVGSGVCLETAIEYVLRCSRFRLPDPSRWADRLSRQRSSSKG